MVSRNFCQNRVRVNFCNFHSVCSLTFDTFSQNFREINTFHTKYDDIFTKYFSSKSKFLVFKHCVSYLMNIEHHENVILANLQYTFLFLNMAVFMRLLNLHPLKRSEITKKYVMWMWYVLEARPPFLDKGSEGFKSNSLHFPNESLKKEIDLDSRVNNSLHYSLETI